MRDLPVSRIVPTDPATYRRLRWRARAWTAVAGAVLTVVVTEIAIRVTSGEESRHASAAWVFFQGGLLLAGLAPVVWFQWRRSYRARPQRLSVDDARGTWLGVPELDAPSATHLSLGPGADPPRRW